MKILIISQYFWPENFRINELSNQLKILGNEVTVLTGLPNYPEGKIYKEFKNNKNKFNEYKGIEIIRVPLVPRKKGKLNLLVNYISFTINATILGLLKLRKKKYDLIFVFQTSPIFIGIPSSIISRVKKIPQIFWVLDIWPETLISVGFKNKYLLYFTKLLVKIIYKNCNLILGQSRSFVNSIKCYKGLKKIEYFPAWSEINFNVLDEMKAKEIEIKEDIFNLMFAGNIGEAQDFPSILSAMEIISNKNIKNFRLLIVGDGSKKDWLIKQIKIKKLNHIVEVFPKYPLEKMPSIFAHADCLLVSLKDEIAYNMTIPGKIQTYLSTGVPIIGMLNGEGSKVIKESGAGLSCSSGDSLKLSELIVTLMKMDSLALKIMGHKGIEYSKKEFDKITLIKKLNRFFSDAIIKKV